MSVYRRPNARIMPITAAATGTMPDDLMPPSLGEMREELANGTTRCQVFTHGLFFLGYLALWIGYGIMYVAPNIGTPNASTYYLGEFNLTIVAQKTVAVDLSYSKTWPFNLMWAYFFMLMTLTVMYLTAACLNLFGPTRIMSRTIETDYAGVVDHLTPWVVTLAMTILMNSVLYQYGVQTFVSFFGVTATIVGFVGSTYFTDILLEWMHLIGRDMSDSINNTEFSTPLQEKMLEKTKQTIGVIQTRYHATAIVVFGSVIMPLMTVVTLFIMLGVPYTTYGTVLNTNLQASIIMLFVFWTFYFTWFLFFMALPLIGYVGDLDVFVDDLTPKVFRTVAFFVHPVLYAVVATIVITMSNSYVSV